MPHFATNFSFAFLGCLTGQFICEYLFPRVSLRSYEQELRENAAMRDLMCTSCRHRRAEWLESQLDR